MTPEDFMRRAIELSRQNVGCPDGGPFGAVVVRAGRVVGEGTNRVTGLADPTAHAEIVAIREAARALGSFRLAGCDLYASCEPCPMCLGAIYWARIERVWFGSDRRDAAAVGFDDEFLYRELALPLDQRSLPAVQILRTEAQQALADWFADPRRVPY